MTLTSLAVKQAQPVDKAKPLYDERGLYLEISPAGGKWWRLKYRFAGEEKRLSLGVYPDIGLKEARAARDGAQRLVAQGVAPAQDAKKSDDSASLMLRTLSKSLRESGSRNKHLSGQNFTRRTLSAN